MHHRINDTIKKTTIWVMATLYLGTSIVGMLLVSFSNKKLPHFYNNVKLICYSNTQ